MNGRQGTARGWRALTGAGAIAVALVVAAPAADAAAADAAAADAPRTDRYTILKDGDPIGSEDIRFEPQGDTLKVSVTTTTRVKVLFVNFRYDHKRDEVWRGGTLESVSATTDDDGTPHTLSMTRGKDGGYTLTVDGKTSILPANSLPLTLWTRDVLKRPVLLSVIDGHPYQVRTDPVGSETVTTAGGQAIPTQHHRIGGDVDRDLWFAADGKLVKTQFKRSGYDIVYLLK